MFVTNSKISVAAVLATFDHQGLKANEQFNNFYWGNHFYPISRMWRCSRVIKTNTFQGTVTFQNYNMEDKRLATKRDTSDKIPSGSLLYLILSGFSSSL